jgi:hypothetical protein
MGGGMSGEFAEVGKDPGAVEALTVQSGHEVRGNGGVRGALVSMRLSLTSTAAGNLRPEGGFRDSPVSLHRIASHRIAAPERSAVR